MQPGPAFGGASWCLPFDTSQFWSLPPGSQPRSANLWHDSIAVSHVVTHPPQSRLSLTAEHHVAVFGSASLRKSIQVSEPAVEMGKRKSLYASLKQWHFLSQWTKTSSSFLFCWGNLFWTKFWTLFQCDSSCHYLKNVLFLWKSLCFSVASCHMNSDSKLSFVQEGIIFWFFLYFCSNLLYEFWTLCKEISSCHCSENELILWKSFCFSVAS